VQILGVGVAFALVAMADLHHELAVLREFQELVVRNRLESGQAITRTIVSAKLYETLVIDVNTVLALRPFIATAISAPSLDVIAGRVEDYHRRRSHGLPLRF
jgi:hypothetical protein